MLDTRNKWAILIFALAAFSMIGRGGCLELEELEEYLNAQIEERFKAMEIRLMQKIDECNCDLSQLGELSMEKVCKNIENKLSIRKRHQGQC